MPFTRYKKYYVKQNFDSDIWVALQTTSNEDEPYPNQYYLSDELHDEIITLEEIENVVRSPIVQKYFKYYLLNDDETIKEDISQYIYTGVAFDKNNEVGQTKSLSITIQNALAEKILYKGQEYNQVRPVKELGYKWTPNANDDILFGYNKIQIFSYMRFERYVYEKSEGIYYMTDPQLTDGSQGHNIQVQLYDKFAMLDGTLQGNDDIDYEIPWGSFIEDAIKNLLTLPRDNKGTPLDFKEVIFPIRHRGKKTAYTIKKTGANSVGELIKELALSISCEAKYNEYGHLEIKDSLADLDYHNRSLAWIYRDSDFGEPNLQINRSSIKNKVTVVGANINGHLVKGEAINDNPDSIYSVNGVYGVRSVKITDDLLSTYTLCEDRARYELKKYAQNYATLTFTSMYIPHMEPGDLFAWTYEKWNIYNEIFLVTSLSQGEDGTMSVSAANVKELPI